MHCTVNFYQIRL